MTPPSPATPSGLDVSPHLPTEISTAPAKPLRPALVVSYDVPRLILAPIAADEWQKNSSPRLVEQNDISFVLQRDIDETKLPPELLALIGNHVTAIDRTGNRCAAKVGAVSAMQITYGDVEPKDEAWGDKWDWGPPALVAEIEDLQPGCSEDLAGALIGEGDPNVLRTAVLPEHNPLTSTAAARWRTSAGYKRAQARFESESADNKGLWDAGSASTVTLVGSPNDGVVLVSLTVGSCGDFEATVTTGYRLKDSKLGDALAIADDRSIDVNGAADFNSDGLPDIFVYRGAGYVELLESANNSYKVVEGPEILWLHCRC